MNHMKTRDEIMTNETAKNLGRLYRALTDAASHIGANQCELTLAQLHPLRAVGMAISKAHMLHAMTPELDKVATTVLADVSLDEMEKDYGDTPVLTQEQRGEFMVGYQLGLGNLFTKTRSIKQARQSAGLTVRGLAEKIGVSPSTITEIEAGRKIPRADTLQKIADACCVTIDQIWPQEE